MCTVIGYYPDKPEAGTKLAFHSLMQQGRIRGQHAYGLFQPNRVFRSFDAVRVADRFDGYRPAIAHCRYSTSGDWQNLENNQPIIVDDRILAFNGVIDMGTKEEMEAKYNVTLSADNDGEVFLRLLTEPSPYERFRQAQSLILSMPGSFAGLWWDEGKFFAGRNARRPLWRVQHLGAMWYCSTRDIFLRAGFPEPTEVEVGAELVENQ